MKLGILQCDRTKELFVKEHGEYPQMYANLLLPADPQLELLVFDAQQAEFPKDIHAADAYLITGSRYGVNDGFPWITQLEDFVRQLHQAKKKVIGICFGHQLIAKALGGKVIKSPKGWGLGMSQNQIIRCQEWMVPPLQELNLLVSHQDQVAVLPKGAQLLASSDFCPNYLMQIDTHMLSVQGHPEFTKAYVRDLIRSREDILTDGEIDQGMHSLELSEDDVSFAQWLIHFINSP